MGSQSRWGQWNEWNLDGKLNTIYADFCMRIARALCCETLLEPHEGVVQIQWQSHEEPPAVTCIKPRLESCDVMVLHAKL